VQERSFVHIDADAYVWKRLPAIVENAAVIAQSPESLLDNGFYEPQRVHALLEAHGGYVPEAWTWYMRHGGGVAACCGIFGGNALEFIHGYASTVLAVVRRPENRAVWALERDAEHNMLMEQYLLCACAAYQREHASRPHLAVRVQYLFPTANFAQAGDVGFTHLIANAKRHAPAVERLERVVRRDYPALYERCVRYAAKVAP
jgi:hypothetical protein